MDMTDTRRARLRKLIDEQFGGVIARFAEAIDRAPNYVSRVLGGKKGIKEDFCRHVEASLRLPMFWMDGSPENYQPQPAPKLVLNPELLWKCVKAVEAHLADSNLELNEENRIKLAAVLYSGYHKKANVTVDEMTDWLDQWGEIIAPEGKD